MIVVAGPTASGKSSLALQLAQRCNGELLCFDSTTVYRGLDIGTAKPSIAERQLVPHHLLDLVEAGEEFTLAHFLQAAQQALEQIRARGRQPILVGGTYLYLRAFLEGFQLPQVAPDDAFRLWAQAQPLAALVEELRAVDPGSTAMVDLANPRRVVRALEVCRSGRLFSQAYQRQPRGEPVRKIGLLAPPEWLRQRIAERSARMFLEGFREEVESLCQKGLQQWLLSMRFIGYPEIIEQLGQPALDSWLAGKVTESTWRLVKKQRTWGRSEGGVKWFPAEDPALSDQVWESLQTPIET